MRSGDEEVWLRGEERPGSAGPRAADSPREARSRKGMLDLVDGGWLLSIFED